MTDQNPAIQVTVATRYLAKESTPAQDRHAFAYTITISNQGGTPAQLLHRSWIITHGNGRRQEVKGPGVVGEQPRLEPGGTFQYTSGVVLEAAVGSMEGHYEFSTDSHERFLVPVPVFTLAVPNAVH